jgi:F0F1-type ATP synthase alpha subunit
VQCPAAKEVGKGLRLEYAQYREMLRMTKLRTHLSSEAMERMRRGEILHDLLMQPNNQPLSLEEEVVLFYAYKSKVLEPVPLSQRKKFISGIFEYLKSEGQDVIDALKSKHELTTQIKADLDNAFANFLKELEKSEEQH